MNVACMTSAGYLSQASHAIGGALAILTARVFLGDWIAFCIVFGAGVVIAAAKEFWFDLRFETDPAQTVMDSTLDFTFYILGGLGLGLGTLAAHLGRIA